MMRIEPPAKPYAFQDGAGPGDAVLPGDLVRVLGWLRTHLDEPVQLGVLADVAGVRPRTLETHFRLFLGTTPLGWVRQMRLVLARQKLVAANRDATVTSIALASGFSQLGRFTAQYRAQFGELPSQTLRRGKVRQYGTQGDVDDEALRLAWQALPATIAVSSDACTAALDQLAQAQELAPAYSLPKALAAWCTGQRAAHHFSLTTQQDRAQALHLAEEACALAPDDPMTLTICSGALGLVHRVEEADRLVERALSLDPWSPLAWSRRCWLSNYRGDVDAALQGFRRLMPYDALRHTSFIGIGCAHFLAGRYDRAALWARSGVEISPGSFWGERIVIAAAAHAGARADARRAARRLLRRDPDLTVSMARQAWPFPADFMDRLADGLLAAGMPRA